MVFLKIKNLLVIVLLLFIFSCNNKSQNGDGLSQEEKQFISRFQNKLLVKTTNRSLDIEEVEIETEDDILSITGASVKPVVYDSFMSTKYMTIEHQKSLFISQLLPQILITKFFLEQEKEMLDIILHDDEIEDINFKDKKIFIDKQLLKHDAENVSDLLQKLTTHPTSLVLAQAAIESNWGSTISFEQANNPFHILSTYKSEPRIKTFGKNLTANAASFFPFTVKGKVSGFIKGLSLQNTRCSCNQ